MESVLHLEIVKQPGLTLLFVMTVEMEKKFRLSVKEVEERLAERIKGYRLIKRMSHSGESLFVLLPEDPKEIKTKERVWSYRLQPDGDPYIVVEFPDDFNSKNIKVVPISDVLFGSPDHESELFDEYINWISRTKRVFTFFNGGIFYENVENPSETIIRFKHKISRIAHKILWVQQGQPEIKGIWRKKRLDPLDILCRDFDIPYFDRPVYADILWKGQIFSFFCFYGATNARKKGQKLNAALLPLEFQEFVMFTVMSRAKDSITDEAVIECREPASFDIKAKPQRIIICPGFVKYYGSREAKKGYPPSSRGTVSCNLYPDGDYHV